VQEAGWALEPVWTEEAREKKEIHYLSEIELASTRE
jgi:hypothetical protein